MENNLLKSILDDEFLETLAKSANLYKIGSNSILDPEEIRIGLKVVPRAVMSMLISELAPMTINSHKDIRLPFGKHAYVSCNKNAADDFTGSVYDDNKLVYSFQNRSIPGLGIILLSTFELYNMEELNKLTRSLENVDEKQDLDKKVQKLIDERMELHSLVNRVVEDKMAQREAIHKLMMDKLNHLLQTPIVSPPSVAPMMETKPIEVKPSDIVKKEIPAKKELPLKKFLERKKKPKEYNVEIAKSEVISCNECGHTIFGEGSFSCCLCYGQDQNKKIWIKKSENGIQIKFSKSWDAENIEMLLETLRRKNGKN